MFRISLIGSIHLACLLYLSSSYLLINFLPSFISSFFFSSYFHGNTCVLPLIFSVIVFFHCCCFFNIFSYFHSILLLPVHYFPFFPYSSLEFNPPIQSPLFLLILLLFFFPSHSFLLTSLKLSLQIILIQSSYTLPLFLIIVLLLFFLLLPPYFSQTSQTSKSLTISNTSRPSSVLRQA